MATFMNIFQIFILLKSISDTVDHFHSFLLNNLSPTISGFVWLFYSNQEIESMGQQSSFTRLRPKTAIASTRSVASVIFNSYTHKPTDLLNTRLILLKLQNLDVIFSFFFVEIKKLVKEKGNELEGEILLS